MWELIEREPMGDPRQYPKLVVMVDDEPVCSAWWKLVFHQRRYLDLSMVQYVYWVGQQVDGGLLIFNIRGTYPFRRLPNGITSCSSDFAKTVRDIVDGNSPPNQTCPHCNHTFWLSHIVVSCLCPGCRRLFLTKESS